MDARNHRAAVDEAQVEIAVLRLHRAVDPDRGIQTFAVTWAIWFGGVAKEFYEQDEASRGGDGPFVDG